MDEQGTVPKNCTISRTKVAGQNLPDKEANCCTCLFKMRLSYHRLLTGILVWLLSASFRKQGALVDSGEKSAEGSGVTPSLFFSRMAASAFIQDAFFTSPFGKSASLKGSSFPCERKNWRVKTRGGLL